MSMRSKSIIRTKSAFPYSKFKKKTNKKMIH